MFTLIIITCIILGINAKRKSPAQIGAALSQIAHHYDPKLVIRMQDHETKMRLAEAKIAREQNTVVKGDLEIELLKLKILESEKNLGINQGGDFQPKDYPN